MVGIHRRLRVFGEKNLKSSAYLEDKGEKNLSYFNSLTHHILPGNDLHVPRLILRDGLIFKGRDTN